VSTALVFWLSVSVTRAPMISVAAAVCTLGIEPRLYNYPKVVAAVVVTWACWRCIDRPVMSRACALGASVAAAVTCALGASVAAAVTIALIAPDFWMLATQGRVARIVEVQTSGAHPIEDWAPPGSVGMRGLTRWLHECPAPSDRVLVMGYHPQVFFYAERPFAAGMVVSYSSYFTDPASQRHAVSRLRQESVLIVITDSPRRLQDQYALIGAYVAGRFTLVAKSGFGDSESYEVLVDRSRRSVRTVRVADVSLPCFVPRQAGGEAF
jgi:hypothetical protein